MNRLFRAITISNSIYDQSLNMFVLREFKNCFQRLRVQEGELAVLIK